MDDVVMLETQADYPVPWWCWVIMAVVGVALASLISLLAFVGRPLE